MLSKRQGFEKQRAIDCDYTVGELFRAYYPKIFAYIYYKTENVYLAEDITQQTFVNAFGSIDSYRWIGKSMGAWLYRIAHNLLVSYYRKVGRYSEVPFDELKNTLIYDEDVEQKFMEGETVEELKIAFMKLNKPQQAVIRLRYFCGLTLKETAFLLNHSVSWVKIVQHRALFKLRSLLARLKANKL